MEIQNVGIIGCGQMGSGIAQLCAQSGYIVLVSENSRELLWKGLTAISASLDKEIKKQRITLQEKDDTLARITGTNDIEGFQNCDLVIEAVVEKLDLKKRILSSLDEICPTGTLLASKTSSLQISEIAAMTKRPDKVLCLHFFNPIPAMNLVEIIKTPATSETTLKMGKEFGELLGKTVVIVQDSPGFIVNCLMTPQILNAVRMVESGIATKEDIDTAISFGLNHPIGPIALADPTGLDTLLTIANNIHQNLKDKQYAAPEMLKNWWLTAISGGKQAVDFINTNKKYEVRKCRDISVESCLLTYLRVR